DNPGAQRVRSLLMYLHNQADAGTMCPVTMTHASIPVLLGQGDVGEPFARRVLSSEYDPAFRPWWEKRRLTVGMGMTEKQGGSDVRSNATLAVPGDNGWYSLTGHKWFFSAPMSDLFLVLAQAPEGLSCFLLPRWRRDGTLNAIRIQRLKHKLGNHSNASSEVEFQDAEAALIGAPGRGIPTIIDMVAQTRLDCMIGSASLMRQAASQALHHARHRSAFGKPLIEQPLMENVLADLALESEASLLMMLRVAEAMEQANESDSEAALARIGTAIGKFWICKRAPGMINEAQECLGGAGYVEESVLPRLYREAPVNSIWEGSGNVQCLDVLRSLERQPETLDVLRQELGRAAGMNADYDLWLQRIGGRLARPEDLQYRARAVVEELAVGLQAAQFLRSGLETEAELFCRSRLVDRQLCYGALPNTRNLRRLLDRASLQTSLGGS
ncbi:MAG: acyl-CoA dehydrogenase family protein, partial [Ectothiorhodospiraceae bacterium]|nr:acyl-CoA dehydrogenase family protein [Ectothiorhodospiraceae bacterium]